MENNSLFESKYDNEFIGLLNEIGLRFEKFNKCDILKIKSWINILMMPCKSNIDKKNRNLYAILLINQMINGKLEEPFIKFANSSNDLKQLSPANIKSQLTKKFYEEIDFEKIENFGYLKQAQFIQNHPNIAEKIKEKYNNKNINNSKINNNNNNSINNNNINYTQNNSSLYQNNFNNSNNFNIQNNNNIMLNSPNMNANLYNNPSQNPNQNQNNFYFNNFNNPINNNSDSQNFNCNSLLNHNKINNQFN
jgi:hypothetical protein